MKVNKYFDHTQLKAFATQKEIDILCKEAMQLDVASVCESQMGFLL